MLSESGFLMTEDGNCLGWKLSQIQPKGHYFIEIKIFVLCTVDRFLPVDGIL
jgi:hypothetical protein